MDKDIFDLDLSNINFDGISGATPSDGPERNDPGAPDTPAAEVSLGQWNDFSLAQWDDSRREEDPVEQTVTRAEEPDRSLLESAEPTAKSRDTGETLERLTDQMVRLTEVVTRGVDAFSEAVVALKAQAAATTTPARRTKKEVV